MGTCFTNALYVLQLLGLNPFEIMAAFTLEDALSVKKDTLSSPLLYLKRIIRLDELGRTFVVRLVMRLQYKDGHKTHHTLRRTILRNAS